KGTGICTGTPPGAIQLTPTIVSLLFGGDVLTWDDARLRTGPAGPNTINPGLANCPGAVTRVVRLDDSGTTQIFKNHLAKVDGGRAGGSCDVGTTGVTWTTLRDTSPNFQWPGFRGTPLPDGATQSGVAATATCSAIDTGNVNGNNGVLNVCEGIVAGT